MKIEGIHNVTSPQVQRIEPNTLRQAEVGRQPQQREQEKQPEQKLSDVSLDKALQEMNKSLILLNERLEFNIHEASNRIVVRVVDKETDEVVKEIPPEKFLDMAVKLRELVGVLVDQRA